MSERGLNDIGAPFVEAVESIEQLEPIGEKVGATVRGALPPGRVKDAVSGTWLGHALHPLLTDVVIGSFTSATLLDLIGGDRSGEARERLIAIGIAAYFPTALTGASDYADSELFGPAIRRVGVAHAATNALALTCYAASLRARRNGNGARGKVLGFLGAGALAAGGYLGGHMSYVQGMGVNQTAFDEGPGEWSEAADAGSVTEGSMASVLVGETPVLIVRSAGGLAAIHDRCSHRGCLLSEGDLDGDVVECKCHGSRFRLSDGSIERGPATTPQPSYETRERGDKIEIRLNSD